MRMVKKSLCLWPLQDNCEENRSCENLQAKEHQKIACIEDNTIMNLKSLHESFPKVNSAWEINHLSNLIMLRIKLITSTKSHTAFQELSIWEDAETKMCNVHLSTLDAIIKDDIKKIKGQIYRRSQL